MFLAWKSETQSTTAMREESSRTEQNSQQVKGAEEKPQTGDRRMIRVQRQLVAFIKVQGMKNKTTISTDLFDMIF